MKNFSLNSLTDTQFEEFCFDLLVELDFKNVRWRKGTGLSTSPADRGRDIECQREQVDVDGNIEIETWFVECKHSTKGVAPEKIQGALAWASAERPNKLLLIASNFFSNPTLDYLTDYQWNNKPTFKIKTWQKTNLEKMSAGRFKLLRKYDLSDELPLLSIIHPAHLSYIRGLTLNRLDKFFQVLDKLDSQPRDKVLDWAYHFIIQPRFRASVTGKEKMSERMIDELSYRNFKNKCWEITHVVPDFVLVTAVVNFTLQAWLGMGDMTVSEEKLDKFESRLQWSEDLRKTLRGETDEHRDSLNFIIRSIREKEPDFKEEDVEPWLDQMDRFLRENVIEGFSERARENYELYTYFCERVVTELLIEDATR